MDPEDVCCVVEGGPLQDHLNTLGLGERCELIRRPTSVTTGPTANQGPVQPVHFKEKILNFIKSQIAPFRDPMPQKFEWVATKVVRKVLAHSKLLRKHDLAWLLQLKKALRTHISNPMSIDWIDFWSMPPGNWLQEPLGLYLAGFTLKQILHREYLYRKLHSSMTYFLDVLECNSDSQKCTYSFLIGHQTTHLSAPCAVHAAGDCPLWQGLVGARGVLPQLKATLALNIDSTMLILAEMVNQLLSIKPTGMALLPSITESIEPYSLELVMEENGMSKIKLNIRIVAELQARILFLLSGSLLLGSNSMIINSLVDIVTKQTKVLQPLQALLVQQFTVAKTSALQLQKVQSSAGIVLPMFLPIYTNFSVASFHTQRLLTAILHGQELALTTSTPARNQFECTITTLQQELQQVMDFINSIEIKLKQLFPEPDTPSTTAGIVRDQPLENAAHASEVFEASGEQAAAARDLGWDDPYETPKLGADVMKELQARLKAMSPALRNSPGSVSQAIQKVLEKIELQSPPIAEETSSMTVTMSSSYPSSSAALSGIHPLQSTSSIADPSSSCSQLSTFSTVTNFLGSPGHEEVASVAASSSNAADASSCKSEMSTFSAVTNLLGSPGHEEIASMAARIGRRLRQAEEYFEDADSDD